MEELKGRKVLFVTKDIGGFNAVYPVAHQLTCEVEDVAGIQRVLKDNILSDKIKGNQREQLSFRPNAANEIMRVISGFL